MGLGFDWSGPPNGLDGRWMKLVVSPSSARPRPSPSPVAWELRYDHPLMQGIAPRSLCSFTRQFPTLSPGAVWVAMYQDHAQLCAYKTNNGHTA